LAEGILNHSSNLDLKIFFSKAFLTLNFDLDLSKVKFGKDAGHLCKISRKSVLYFSRNHNSRNEQINQQARLITIPSGGDNK